MFFNKKKHLTNLFYISPFNCVDISYRLVYYDIYLLGIVVIMRRPKLIFCQHGSRSKNCS